MTGMSHIFEYSRARRKSWASITGLPSSEIPTTPASNISPISASVSPFCSFVLAPMDMDIKESRCDDQSGGIEYRKVGNIAVTERPDLPATNYNVGNSIDASRRIHQPPILYEQVHQPPSSRYRMDIRT